MDYKKLHEETLTALQQMVSEGKITEEIARSICADFVNESEDERIRKSLIKSYTNQHPSNFPTVDGFTREQILAWLEKQDKLPHWEKSVLPNNTVTSFNSDYFIYNGYFINYKELFNILPKDDFDFEKNGERKPTWSEDDEKVKCSLVYLIEEIIRQPLKRCENWKGYIDWLESLKERYTWKPSESDILLLERIANGKFNPQDFQASLGGLIGQLKKLMEK